MGVITARIANADWSARAIFLTGITLIAAARLAIAGSLELHFDEAYYWYWSQHPQLSYYDHPPMVAWFIRIGTAIAGNSELGVRLAAQFATVIGSWLIFDATEKLYGERAALITGLAMQATLLVGAGSILMTPDAPLMLFLSVMLWALVRFCVEPRGFWWIIAGGAGGLAMSSKYTAVLAAVSVGFWMIASPKVRRWAVTPWPWLGAMVAVVAFSPVLIWNYQNNWISFGKQGGRLDWTNGVHPTYVLEYIGSQLGLVTPVLFVLLLIAVWYAGRRAFANRNAVDTLLASLFFIPGVFFLAQSPFMRVQGNWPSLIWAPAFIAAAAMVADVPGRENYRRWLNWGIAAGAALVIAVWFHALTPDLFCWNKDPVRLLHGNRAFAASVAETAHARGVSQIVVADYATAATLRYYAPNTVQIVHMTQKPRYVGFNEPGIRPGASAGLVSRGSVIPQGLHILLGSAGAPSSILRKHNACSGDVYTFNLVGGRS